MIFRSPATPTRLRPLPGAAGALALALAAFMNAAPAWAAPITPTADVRFASEAAGGYAMPVRSLRDMPFRTVVRQQYDYSCGSAAVATLLSYHYGLSLREADIFTFMWQVGDRAAISRVGFSMLDMKRYLEAKGFMVDGYRMSLDELEQERTPAIALIDLGRYRHFVVIKGVRKDEVLVGDPARGIKIMPRADFEKIWNHIVLMVHDSPTKPRFDDPAEWRPYAPAPLRDSNPTESLAAFSRDLQPLFQITRIVSEPPLP